VSTPRDAFRRLSTRTSRRGIRATHGHCLARLLGPGLTGQVVEALQSCINSALCRICAALSSSSCRRMKRSAWHPDRRHDRRRVAPAALSGWREADSESARALLTAFVDGRLSRRLRGRHGRAGAGREVLPQGRRAICVHQSRHRRSAGLRHGRRSAQVNGAVRAAEKAAGEWAAMTGTEARACCAARRIF